MWLPRSGHGCVNYGVEMYISVDDTPELIGRVTVLLDGLDVTNQTREADDGTGDIVLLCRDASHHRGIGFDPFHILPDGDGDPCIVKKRGKVQIVVRESQG